MLNENVKRFNMAFTKENYEYVSFMAGVKGVSMTDLLNDIVSRDSEKNYEAVKAIKGILNGSNGEDD